MFFTKNPFLTSVLRKEKKAISYVYLLNVVEQLSYLLLPATVGMVINTFITGEGTGIWAFAGCYLTWQGIATLRKVQDTIVFSRIYNTLIVSIVEKLRIEKVETTIINARVELLKQVVAFFETDLPFLVSSLVAMIGAAALLFFYNQTLMFVCIIIILPSLILNYFFGKKMVKVTNLVNNEYEKQVEIIDNQPISQVAEYLKTVRQYNIQKSSLEAYNFMTIELFVFAMILISLYIICRTPSISYGDIVATYGYILRFAYSFDFIPHLTERIATLRDILQRLETEE
jgi:ABC-type bacteriocin/lantibiotic exporter with double-glycine peptidase domain